MLESKLTISNYKIRFDIQIETASGVVLATEFQPSHLSFIASRFKNSVYLPDSHDITDFRRDDISIEPTYGLSKITIHKKLTVTCESQKKDDVDAWAPILQAALRKTLLKIPDFFGAQVTFSRIQMTNLIAMGTLQECDVYTLYHLIREELPIFHNRDTYEPTENVTQIILNYRVTRTDRGRRNDPSFTFSSRNVRVMGGIEIHDLEQIYRRLYELSGKASRKECPHQ